MYVSSEGSGESAHMCADWPEPLLLADVVIAEILRTGSYILGANT